ncbi:MAG: PCMD domain-containing protein [Bacteroidales bacterium]|nr:PCMD domain-containing protein [Bacteroidales bacterium]
MKHLSYLLLISLFVFSSCIKDVPLNPEADILSFTWPDDSILISSKIANDYINVFVADGAKIDSIAPTITVTPGATIFPPSGEARNFETTQYYTVHSQDGVHSKKYSVNFLFSLPTTFDFEHWITKSFLSRKYDIPVDANNNNIWASGNSGIVVYMNPPYPTQKTTAPNEVYSGTSAAKMITMKGPGSILGTLYIPIVAGSLFIGEFKLDMEKPVRSPKFGLPYALLPKSFKGVYKYKEGSGNYINSKGQEVPGINDSCSIYSILYEVTEQEPVLNGESVLTSPNIVAFAKVPATNGTPGDDFIPFDIPFDYPKGLEAINFENKKYNFAIVLSSSARGDYYEGKIGSTLIVDDLKIITE